MTMIKDPNLPKKAPKRFEYSLPAYVEVGSSRQPIQIQNISKTGIQFLSSIAISQNIQVRLTWEDPKMGPMVSQVMVVRTIDPGEESKFPYCYGSKFIHLKEETRKNMNRLVETTEEHERKYCEKMMNTVPFRTINDVITHGRAFLRDLIKGKKSIQMIDEIAADLKPYEREAFEGTDDLCQWLQKLTTQNFHCRVLLVVLANSLKVNDVNKLVNDKIQTIDCLVAECQKFIEVNRIAKTRNGQGGIHESLNRLIFSRVELADTLHKRDAGNKLFSRHI